LAGSVLGVVVGLVQASWGSQIPDWTGDKREPVALGILTVALALLAGLAAVRQPGTDGPLGRAACAVGLVGPGLLGLTTAGRLWYLPAVALVAAGLVTVESRQATVAVLGANWWRVLLSVLAVTQLVMAAGAAPVPMAVGAIGGVALLIAAWLRTGARSRTWALVVVGAVPFAVVAWAAVVPVLVAVEALGLAAVISRRRAA
jgi:hypothetical protein